MPGARCTRGLVCKSYQGKRTRAYRAPKSPGIPARNGFTAYHVLSLVHGLFGHHRPRFPTHGFDISVAMPGPHAFAVRVRPPSSQGQPFRVHRILSRVDDVAQRPSVTNSDGSEYRTDFYFCKSELSFFKKEFFIARGLTVQAAGVTLICPSGSHTRRGAARG